VTLGRFFADKVTRTFFVDKVTLGLFCG